MSGDPPIIITGGSVRVVVPDHILTPEAGTRGKFKRDDKRITRVEISGHSIRNYEEDTTGNDIEIRVFYGDDGP